MCIAFWLQRLFGFDKKSLNKTRRSMTVLAIEHTHRSLTLYPICEHPVRRSRFSLQQHCVSRQSKRQLAGKEGDTAKCRDAKGVVGVVQENFSVMCPPGAVWWADIVPPSLLKTHLRAILLLLPRECKKAKFWPFVYFTICNLQCYNNEMGIHRD
jgi:hypothetical protein